ncbi:MAG: tRNA 4-thiouridine(8) synthase ThiI [Candidatus Micrarchaeota archaeon]|nr:tRNA 4-thiouridine(8) synthase ThiI [Candidatus Micrarchaeota archaeon]
MRKETTYKKAILIHFGELWLKGDNRRSYIDLLKRNIAMQLGLKKGELIEDYDKLLIPITSDAKAAKLLEKLKYVVGVSNYSISYTTDARLDSIVKLSESILKEIKKSGVKNLRIDSSRAYKGHKFTSKQIIEKIVKLAAKLKLEPDIDEKNNRLIVKVYKEKAFVSFGKSDAVHGLPVGSSGKAVIMFSGGIDSPVAAWYAMRRGAIPIYLHIHGFPKNEMAEESKVPQILEELAKYYPNYKVYYMPAHIFQLALSKIDNKFEPILLKALLFRASEIIAEKEGAGVIVTGESLGQVASQTMANLAASQQGIKLPILRPVIGFDKQEIIKIARKINTYDLSIKPYKDVCSITTTNTVINASSEKVEKLMKEMKMDKVIERSLKASKVVSRANR